MPKKIAITLPRSRSGNESITIARAAGNMIAAPAPCRIRKLTIQASAAPPVGVAPQSPEQVAKMAMPSSTMLRCPAMSARRPPNANRAASESR